MNKVENEFSKHANEYNSYNIIQQIVSKALVREISSKPKRILELGCGSGQVFKNIDFDFDHYKAIDFSQTMCDIHPKENNLDIFCLDFDSVEFYNNIKNERYDLVLSSSALQWSQNLSKIISALKDITDEINMVLFTSNTFKTIFKINSKISPILDIKTIKNGFDKSFKCKYEVLNYKLEFDDKKSLFNYIKNSGVSGDSKPLSFKEAKNLYKNYNLNYLEFEVIFIKGKNC
ncbi:MAG: methyltransferase domain-containing protein [Campylobacterota bacterium]|nr:methyltransferase domain-containing protein [Campylobacterota bacterium]